jgi:hypothetical protein
MMMAWRCLAPHMLLALSGDAVDFAVTIPTDATVDGAWRLGNESCAQLVAVGMSTCAVSVEDTVTQRRLQQPTYLSKRVVRLIGRLSKLATAGDAKADARRVVTLQRILRKIADLEAMYPGILAGVVTLECVDGEAQCFPFQFFFFSQPMLL